ncbi:tetratricopeptide repeat protein [Empedobacter falsenii]
MIQQSFLRKTLFTLTFLPLFSYSQETKSSDDFFLEARHKAFEEKDYTAAKKLALQALAQSPEYTDIAVFLGRIYTWNDETDEARKVFQNIEKTMDPSTDFYLAYTSLEYWNENYTEAISIIDRDLIKYPKHEELLLLKAKIQNSGDLYSDASETIKELIAINPKNT